MLRLLLLWCFPPALLVPQNAKSDAPWSMAPGSWLLAPWPVACCWRSCPGTCTATLSARASHPLLPCPFPHPILAFSRFLGSNPLPPPSPPPAQAPRRPSLQPPRALQLVVSTVARSSRLSTCPSIVHRLSSAITTHCIARGRPRMNLQCPRNTPTPALISSAAAPAPAVRRISNWRPAPTMGISSGKR